MDGDAETDPPSAEVVEKLSRQGRIAAADLQLVHAMLLHIGDREAASRQSRIDRVIHAIRELPEGAAGQETTAAATKAGPRRRVRLFLRWVVAASLIGAVSWYYLSASDSALAALDRVVQAVDAPVDRTYEIRMQPADLQLPRKAGREPGNLRPEDRRPGLDGAILYVRGGTQFVLYRSTPRGKMVINGSNGFEQWLIRPGKPVLVSSDPYAFRIPMPESLATIPLVDIRLSLTSLRHGYQLDMLPDEKLDDGTSTLWRHLRAQKIDPATKGPKVVSIWYHPSTNLIGRIEFEQMHLQGRPEPRSMTISLVACQPLPDNWFEHAAHHPADTPVESVDP